MFSKPLKVIIPGDGGDEGRLSFFAFYVSELNFLCGNEFFYFMYSKNVEKNLMFEFLQEKHVSWKALILKKILEGMSVKMAE